MRFCLINKKEVIIITFKLWNSIKSYWNVKMKNDEMLKIKIGKNCILEY